MKNEKNIYAKMRYINIWHFKVNLTGFDPFHYNLKSFTSKHYKKILTSKPFQWHINIYIYKPKIKQSNNDILTYKYINFLRFI